MFRLLVGAALVRALWKSYWKWALPKKRPLEINGLINIMRTHYLDPIKEALNEPTPFWTSHVELPGVTAREPGAFEKALDKEVEGAWVDHFNDMHRYAISYKPPKLTRTQKLRNKIKYKLRRLRPVITTKGKIEDLEYYD